MGTTTSIRGKAAAPALAWLLPVGGIILMLLCGSRWTPWERLAFGSAGLLILLKGTIVLLRVERLPLAGLLAYFLAWPGMDPAAFQSRAAAADDSADGFAGSLVRMLLGLAGILAVGLAAPLMPAAAVGWLGIAALLLTVHFGFAGVLTAFLRLGGWQVSSLFRQPLRSASLGDFWTRRWNLAFVEMDRILFMRPLTRLVGVRWAVFGVFLISGVLHELAISFPAGGGWGGPLLYFAIQGGLVLLEKRLRIRSRLLAWVAVLAPLPLLFHGPFRTVVVTPAFLKLHDLLVAHSSVWYWSVALWLLGAAQFSVLLASFQVPGKLGWHEDLPKLRPFNRKLMWTYAVTIVTTVIGFGIMTLALHAELLRGDRAALAIASFIAAFWTLRLVVDAVYYDHKDWPKGAVFVVGHAMLNCLFICLVAGYGGIVAWHLLS